MANESSVLVRLRLLGGSQFAREAKGAGRSLGSIGSQSQRVSTRLNGVNKALGVAAMAMRTVGTGGAIAVGTGLAYGVKQSVNFEQAMANVQARLLTTKTNMRLLSDEAIKLGGQTSFSANEAAGAMGELAAAGFTTQEIMRMMPGTLGLAAAAGTDLSFAAETSGALLRQFGMKAGDASHLADVLTVAVNRSAIGMDDLALTMKYVGPVAGRFNQSVEDIAASAAILGNVGIKGETAGTTLRRAFVNIVRPSVRTQKVLSGMGITTNEFAKATVNAKGQLRPFPAMIGNLAKHIGGLTAPDQRRALAQLFGVEALPGMLTLMGKGQKGIESMAGSLYNSQGAWKRTAAIMRGTVKGAWDQFTGSVESASIKLLQRFNPAIRRTLVGASKLTTKLTEGVSGFAAGVGGATAKPTRAVGERAQGNAAELSGAEKAGIRVRAALAPVIAWAQANLPKLGAALMSAGRSLMEAFAPAMPFIQNVVLPLLKGIAIGVLGGVVTAFKIAVGVIKVVATVLGFIGKAAAPLKPVFQALGTVVGFFAGGPLLAFLGKLRYLGVVFKLLLLPIRVAMGALGAIGRVVMGVGRGFLRTLTSVQRFVGTFTGLPARLATAALNIVGGVVNVIARMPGRLLSLAKKAGGGFISGIVNAAKSGASRLASAMGQVGRGMVNGVVDAIKAAPKTIVSTLLDLIPGPLRGAAKKVLGWTGLATGGRVVRGGAAVVGERGPELVDLPTGSTVYDSRQSQAAMALASPPPMTLVANLHLNGKQIHSEVFRVDRLLAEAT